MSAGNPALRRTVLIMMKDFANRKKLEDQKTKAQDYLQRADFNLLKETLPALSGYPLLSDWICDEYMKLAGGQTGGKNFTGDWQTSWGVLSLTQSDGSVSGCYTHDRGKITGTVSANVITGQWSESPSYSPPKDAGEVVFTLDPGGNSFAGKWRYGSSGSFSDWGGTRISAVPSACN